MFFIKSNIIPVISAGEFHAYTMIYLLFSPAFLAFLFTTFPKFSATSAIPQQHFLGIFWMFLAGMLLFMVGVFISKILLAIAMGLILLAQLASGNVLLSIYNISPMDVNEKRDQYWISIAIAFGIVSNLFFILSLWMPSFHNISIKISIYLYLFLVTFTVAQRMIPFFSQKPIEKHIERFKVIVGLLGLHVVLETLLDNSSFLTDFFLAYLLGKEILRWKLPFPNPNPMIWILHISLFWIPISFLLSGIASIFTLTDGTNFFYLDIHTIGLGFLLTLLIGFGTRVTLGHAGMAIEADRQTVLLFYWTQVVVFVRIHLTLTL